MPFAELGRKEEIEPTPEISGNKTPIDSLRQIEQVKLINGSYGPDILQIITIIDKVIAVDDEALKWCESDAIDLRKLENLINNRIIPGIRNMTSLQMDAIEREGYSEMIDGFRLRGWDNASHALVFLNTFCQNRHTYTLAIEKAIKDKKAVAQQVES